MAKKTKKLVREGGPIRESDLSIREEQELEAETFQYVPYEATNPLHIDSQILKNIRDDFGFNLLWIAESVLGQSQDETVSARRKNGFAEVVKGNFGGILDHLCGRDGRIEKGGLVLFGRPYQIEEIARAYEKKQAKQAISTMRQKHREEGIDVPMPGGGKHKSALAQNRHHTEYAVPED